MSNLSPISGNVLEMYKGAGIQWKPGLDPEFAIKKIYSCLFKDDGSRNVIPIEKMQQYGQMQKAFTQPGSATSGLAQYDLEQGAKMLYPITTIFRNIIARLTGGTGIQSNWRSVTAVNPTNINIGLSEGHRGAFMSQTVVDRTAPFRTSGLDDYVTEQAYLASVTFEDLYALAATTTLQGTMEQEEKLDIGANASLSLGTGSTPTGTQGTGGKLADGSTYSVIVVPLTYFGMINSTAPSVSSALALSGGAIALPYTRINSDGSSDLILGFSGKQSAASSAITISSGSNVASLTVSCDATNGAFGYAWFMGATSGAENLVAITGYPTATLVNTNSTGQPATAVPGSGYTPDPSINALNYDGILTQIVAPGSGAYVKDLGGAALTTSGSGSGGISEFDDLIADRIANYRLVPTDIFMSPYDQGKAAALILTGNTNLAPFIMGDASANGLSAAAQLKVYNNKVGYGTPQLTVHAHPFIPRGTIIFYSRTNPYPLSNVPNLIRKLCRRDYWQVDWPVVTLNRTLGVYFDAVLQMYFPPAFGVITGVKM